MSTGGNFLTLVEVFLKTPEKESLPKALEKIEEDGVIGPLIWMFSMLRHLGYMRIYSTDRRFTLLDVGSVLPLKVLMLAICFQPGAR